jgi:hypothetical protein
MRLIKTTIETDATPEEVWAVLMDFTSYPTWNPMVVSIKGYPEIGARLQTTIAMKSGRRMSFSPRVVELDVGRRFGWLGKLWLPGVFDGLHRFEVVANGAGATFVHSEEFRGLLPPILGSVLKDTHEAVVAMNEALVAEVARRAVQAESDNALLRH